MPPAGPSWLRHPRKRSLCGKKGNIQIKLEPLSSQARAVTRSNACKFGRIKWLMMLNVNADNSKLLKLYTEYKLDYTDHLPDLLKREKNSPQLQFKLNNNRLSHPDPSNSLLK